MRYSERKNLNGDIEAELKLTEDELANINYRLDKEGFKDLQEMVDAFIKSDYPERKKKTTT